MATVRRVSCTVSDSADRRWVTEVNGPGFGSLRVPAGVAAPGIDDVVAVSLDGQVPFRWVVTSVEEEVVGEAGDLWTTAQGPGLMALLGNAIVTPRGTTLDGVPPDQANTQDRSFLWSAYEILDKDSGVTWATPEALAWGDDTTAREGYPDGWEDVDPDGEAFWVWPTAPDVEAPEGAVSFFRYDMSSGSFDGSYRLWMTADNGYELFLDGRLLDQRGAMDEGGKTWMTTYTVDVDLDGSDHVLAVKVTNAAKIVEGNNPAGFLMCARKIDPEFDNPLDWEMAWVSSSGWQCATTEPQFLVGDVLDILLAEAVTLGMGPLPEVDHTDCTKRVSRSWAVGTTLLDVVLDLAELLDLAVWTDGDGVVHVADDPDGVGVALTDSTNLMRLTVTQEAAQAGRALVRWPDGWVWAGTGAQVRYVEAGQAGDVAAATKVGEAALRELGARRIVQAGQCAALDTVPTPGGTITFPGGSGLCVSVSVEEDDAGTAYWTPEIELEVPES